MILKRLFAFVVLFVIFGSVLVLGEGDSPMVEAHGAILMDAATGRVLWEKNSREPLAMASTTKIMTAVLALEQGRMDDVVTVSKRAAAAARVKMYLQPGEEISLGGLLYALMMQSSNDAAVAIAEHISGSVEAFCAAMTAKAAELGATDTIFETPNGLDAGNHQSTAYDMALIARYALSNTMFLEIINTAHKTVTSSRTTYSISNKNRLLHEFEGANGVKTGFTNKAGHCFVGSAKRDDMQLISVVFASGWGQRGKEQKWVDTKRILNYGFDNFEYEVIINEGDLAGELSILRSKTATVPLEYSDGIMLPLCESDKAKIEVIVNIPPDMLAPVAENQVIGEAQVSVGGVQYATIPILATQGAARHDLKTSLEKVLKQFLQLGSNTEINITLPEF